MDNNAHVWQRQDLAKLFLEDVRGGIPLAAEQIDVLLRVVRHAIPGVERLLDLGCGDGILGRTVMAEYPQANGVFLDFSEHMIEAAKKKADIRRATFVVQDLGVEDLGAIRQRPRTIRSRVVGLGDPSFARRAEDENCTTRSSIC